MEALSICEKRAVRHRRKLKIFCRRKIPTLNIDNSQKKFPRLKVIAHRINEIWSVEVAYVDKLAKHNNEDNYLLVVVDVLSRYVRVQPMKALYSNDAAEAFKKMIKNKKPEIVWTDKAPNSKENSKNFVKKREFIYIQQKTKPSWHLQRGTFDCSKTIFTDFWRKSGPCHTLKIFLILQIILTVM